MEQKVNYRWLVKDNCLAKRGSLELGFRIHVGVARDQQLRY